jgi:chromate transporter
MVAPACGNRSDVMEHLLELAVKFCVISMFAIGGGTSSIIPLIHDETVVQWHWLDDRTFAEFLAVAQATPGPNFMLIPLIGWHVAGLAGALVSLTAFLAVSVALAMSVGRLLKSQDTAILSLIRGGFRPVTAGFWVSAGLVIARTTDHAWVTVGITAAVAVLVLKFELNPLWWCLGGGLLAAWLM